MSRTEKIRAALARFANLTAREIAREIKAADEEVKFISSYLCTAKDLESQERECSVTHRMAKAYFSADSKPVAAPKAVKAPLPGNGPRCEDIPHEPIKPAPKAAPKAAPAAPAASKAAAPKVDSAALLKLDPTGMIRTNLPDNNSHTHRFEILSASSDRVYIVAKSRAKGDWQCSCPGWIHHRNCKHLKALVPFLAAAEREAKKIAAE